MLPKLMILRTRHNPKPIPTREHDWDAWIDGREEQIGTAHGPTQTAAVEELMEHISTMRLREALQKSVEQVSA